MKPVDQKAGNIKDILVLCLGPHVSANKTKDVTNDPLIASEVRNLNTMKTAMLGERVALADATK